MFAGDQHSWHTLAGTVLLAGANTPALIAAMIATLQVKVGLEEVADDLFRVKPYVYSAPDHSAVIVFSGVK